MRFLLPVPFLLMFCFSTIAQEDDVRPQERVMRAGRGVVCDTAKHAERFVALRDNGRDAQFALETVNEEAHADSACVVALVMFSGDKPVAELILKGRLISIVEITVHAFGNQRAWRRIPALTQYTIVVEKGVVI